MMYFKMIERKGYYYSLSVGFNKYKFILFPMFYLTLFGKDFIGIEVGWFTLLAKFEKTKKITNDDFKSIQELLTSLPIAK